MYSLTLESQYRATTLLHVAPKSTAVFNLRELFLDRRDPAFQSTQIGIMRSRVLLANVVERLELDKSPYFSGTKVSVLSKLKQKVGLGGSKPSAENRKRLIAYTLRNKIDIDSAKDSYLMTISLDLPDPQLAADITNALAAEYIESVESNQRKSTEASEEWLLNRLAVVNADLKQAEFELQEFKEREDIIGSSRQNDGMASQEVDMISSRLLEAKQKRLASAALYQQIVATEKGKGDLQGINAIQNDLIVQSIRKELLELESRRGELTQRYGSEHRRMIEVNSQIAAANENLQRQTERVVLAIKSEYELAKESEAFLTSSLGASTNKVQSLGRKQFDLLGLEQNVRTQRDVYQAFLTRLNESRATGVSVNENVRIVDPAGKPLQPLASKAPLLVVLLSVLSGLLGLFIGLLRELFDNTISNDDDVDKTLGTISLGSVPLIDDIPDEADPDIAYNYFGNHLVSQFSECIRTVRSSLMVSSIDETKRRILVTSTVPGEGKTSMAISLAMAFGQVQKTLLIDCDLRRPSLDGLLDSTPFNRRRVGLSDLCLGTASPSECIHSLPITGLHVIMAGTVNPNPQELFCSTKFSEVLDKLSEVYDVIVIDSPPSGGLSDAMLLSTYVDQIAYVIKANSTPVTKIRAAIQSMLKSGAPITGAVLNQVPLLDSSFSYYYGRGYYAESLQYDAKDAGPELNQGT